jgi:hypothetical protein
MTFAPHISSHPSIWATAFSLATSTVSTDRSFAVGSFVATGVNQAPFDVVEAVWPHRSTQLLVLTEKTVNFVPDPGPGLVLWGYTGATKPVSTEVATGFR